MWKRSWNCDSMSSSSALRAVAPSASDIAAFRASVSTAQFDAFAAADIHFITVPWAARIDARNFDFVPVLGEQAGAGAQALDQLVELLADRAKIRVDRGSRVSSVVSYARAAPLRSESQVSPSSQRALREAPQDVQFDGYSRLVAEAERQIRQHGQRG